LELVQDEVTPLVTLSLVCRKWNGVVASCPLLWRTISVTYDGDTRCIRSLCNYVEMALARSKRVPLDITINLESFVGPREYFHSRIRETFQDLNSSSVFRSWDWDENCPMEVEYRKVFEKLIKLFTGDNGSHMWRWRTLRLILPEEDGYTEMIPHLWPLFSGDASYLKELTIQANYDDVEDFRRLEKSFLHLRNLESLHIPEHFALSSFDVEPRSIRHLSLHEVKDWSNLVQFSSFINLRTLRYSVEYVTRHPAISSVVQRVYLPFLQTLSLEGAHHNDVLNLFDLPILSTVYLLDSFDFATTFHSAGFFAKVPDIRMVCTWETWEMMVDGLPNFRAVASMTISEEMVDEVVETIDSLRSENHKCLPNLRNIYPGDSNGERNGDPVEVPVPQPREDAH
jgi:hypothetical protein